jgi:hypothetical protein
LRRRLLPAPGGPQLGAAASLPSRHTRRDTNISLACEATRGGVTHLAARE